MVDPKDNTSGDEWSSPHGLDPMTIMRMASAYWHSCIIHAANHINVFNIIGDKKKDIDTLVKETNTDKRVLDSLLTACVTLGLLEREGNSFSNTLLSRTFLTWSSKFYQGGIVYMFENWYASWGKLLSVVRTGKPAVQMHREYSEEETKNYIMGMHNRALSQSKVLMDMVNLSGKRQFLDVGGGPGTFTIMFCKKYPELRGIVMDLPHTLRITREIIKEYNITDRVSTREGDYNIDPFVMGNDAILLSSMTNQESPERIKSLLKKCFDSMNSKGIIMLQEQLLNPEKTGPQLAALIGVNQCIHTEGGRAYSTTEMEEFMRDIGFVDILSRPMSPPSPFMLITASKP